MAVDLKSGRADGRWRMNALSYAAARRKLAKTTTELLAQAVPIGVFFGGYIESFREMNVTYRELRGLARYYGDAAELVSKAKDREEAKESIKGLASRAEAEGRHETRRAMVAFNRLLR